MRSQSIAIIFFDIVASIRWFVSIEFVPHPDSPVPLVRVIWDQRNFLELTIEQRMKERNGKGELEKYVKHDDREFSGGGTITKKRCRSHDAFGISISPRTHFGKVSEHCCREKIMTKNTA